MKLIKIEIENYKSIGPPVSICFHKNLPAVLIGKNGSGKSNILEAVEHIASTNANFPGRYSAGELRYKAYIRLEENEFNNLFPNEEYSQAKATFAAYASKKGSLQIDTIESEIIVPLLKKELYDINEIASELSDAVSEYEDALKKIECEDNELSTIRGYDIIDATGATTNFLALKFSANFFIERVKALVSRYTTNITEENTFIFTSNGFGWETYNPTNTEIVPFKLKYKKPQLAPFQQKYITIDESAIRCEITKINKKTENACRKVNELLAKLKEQSERLVVFDTKGAIPAFLQKVRCIFGSNCGYLLSENSQVLFKDLKKEHHFRYYDSSRIIFEAYAKATKNMKLLEEKERKFEHDELKDFEQWLNANRPEFDKGMYESIQVSQGEKNEIFIQLVENNGQIVSLNETSAGRRWYFTYCFVKCTLSVGDTFIIDEPASMLHPSAQKEIFEDLMKLSETGIRVIYSTHSPYLIPEEWKYVGFVNMENCTKISYVDTRFKKSRELKSIVGDIFDWQGIVETFQQNPQAIAKNCYKAIKEKDKSLEQAATELKLTVETIKSWNRKGTHFRSPKLEHVMAVALYTGIYIKDLLK